jgi:hypothetical protein
MSVEWEEDVPPERPEPGDGEPEVHDQPLGVPAESEPEDAPLPGLPEKEPPSSG